MNSTQASKLLREWDYQVHSGTLTDMEIELVKSHYMSLLIGMKLKGYLQCDHIRKITGRPCGNIISKKESKVYKGFKAGIWCLLCTQEFNDTNPNGFRNSQMVFPMSKAI